MSGRTVVASPPLRDAHLRSADPRATALRTVRVGLLGFGTVGRGLAALLDRRRDEIARRHGLAFEIVAVLVRDVARAREAAPARTLVTSDPEAFVAGRYDVVVEALGGVEPAAALVGGFLARGVDVASANKALLASRWDELHALAASRGSRLRWEASVAAGIPVVGVLQRALQSTRIARIAAIVNATSNLALGEIARGVALPDAIATAQRLGIAEANAALDVSGVDAAQKLAVLVATLRGRAPALDEIEVSGIESVRPEDAARAAALGGRLKPIAFADLDPAQAAAWVAPAWVPDGHPLARIDGASNGLLLSGDTVPDLFLAGPGAGAAPTAAALLDDLLALAHGERTHAQATLEEPLRFRPASSRWFVTVQADALDDRLQDVLEVVGASGLLFRELRLLRERDGSVLAGITAPLERERIERTRARLESSSVVRELRAWRVLDAPAEEAER